MTGSIYIVGTNEATKKLSGEKFDDVTISRNDAIHKIILNDKKYLLDIKKTYIYDDHMLIFCNLRDDENWAGNIAFEFVPNNSIDTSAN
jgi:hypothetical protein